MTERSEGRRERDWVLRERSDRKTKAGADERSEEAPDNEQKLFTHHYQSLGSLSERLIHLLQLLHYAQHLIQPQPGRSHSPTPSYERYWPAWRSTVGLMRVQIIIGIVVHQRLSGPSMTRIFRLVDVRLVWVLGPKSGVNIYGDPTLTHL